MRLIPRPPRRTAASRRRLAGAVFAFCSLLAAGSALARAGTWFDDQTLEHAGVVRWFRYYVPDVEPPGGYAVVFLLHGGSGDMNQVTGWSTYQEWPEIADENGILLIVPNGTNPETGDAAGDDQFWNDCRADQETNRSTADDVGFIDALIDWAGARFPVDLERVYATGGSNGGFMSYRLAFELGHRIAAVAAFIANLPAVDECFGPGYPISVMIANGDADRYIPWDGGCGANDPDCRRGTTRSALATRDFFVRYLGADPTPQETIEHPDLAPDDQTTVRSERYTGGASGTEVWFYHVRDGGHNAPSIEHPIAAITRLLLGLGNQNRDVEGAREAWSFFARHTLHDDSPLVSPGAAGPLRLSRASDGSLILRWDPDCGAATAYGIYRGDLDAGYASIAPVPGRCDEPGPTATLAAGPARGEFFLIVPNDGAFEGSYGRARGSERPPAATPCRPPTIADDCARVGIDSP